MYCPQCGTRRAGNFRFCRSCGLDFDNLPDAGASSATTQPAGPATTWSAGAAPPPAPGPPVSRPVQAPQVAVATPATTAGGDVSTYRLLTLVAWLVSALFLGWLALLQLNLGSYAEGMLALGAWNALMAAAIVYGAVRLNRGTKRSSYRTSALWAILIVVLQGLQIVGGAIHFAYVGATIAAAGAGIFAWLTYQAMPSES